MRAAWGLVLLGVMATGCASRASRLARRLEGRYDVAVPDPTAWTPVDPGGADRAWWNGRVGATLYTDSNCGPRFQDTRLDLLADGLTRGLTDPEDGGSRDLTVDGRAARYRVRTGTLDGLRVRVGSVTLNKDACTYDFVVIAPPDRFATVEPDLLAVVDGFHAGSTP